MFSYERTFGRPIRITY